MTRIVCGILFFVILLPCSALSETTVEIETGVEAQPLMSLARRLWEVREGIGAPLDAAQKELIERASRETDNTQAVTLIQNALDRDALLVVKVTKDRVLSVQAGAPRAELVHGEWRLYLLKVINNAGLTSPLKLEWKGEVAKQMDAEVLTRNWRKQLNGLEVDYLLIGVRCRDGNNGSGDLVVDTEGENLSASCRLDFACQPTREIMLEIHDDKGAPCIAALEISDQRGQIHPAQINRAAPDFWFQKQVYRKDGESIRLPDGEYVVRFSRGPESIEESRRIVVDENFSKMAFKVKRWIDPAAAGWVSSDHHIHAAGCLHFDNPTAGVRPQNMARQCAGEDLKIGVNLTWGPCFDFQKQFFTGREDETSSWPFLIRYDIEVSGFGSHESGHLCLLGLKEQIYPGGDSSAHWPTLGLNTLRWAKKQDALCGPAHSGLGLKFEGNSIPNYEVPPMDGNGACEAIVDIAHEVPDSHGRLVPAIDFISTCDTHPLRELNFWYHTLNAGFRARVSGETDFPCMYGDRVGMGRGYVHLQGRYTYEDWLKGIREGRAYVGDGRSHFLDFRVSDLAVGTRRTPTDHPSELNLEKAGKVPVKVSVAAYLPETVTKRTFPSWSRLPDTLRGFIHPDLPEWHLERARIGGSRSVPVELIVNGHPVAVQNIEADGTLRELHFDAEITQSSWVAVRIFPSSHTNPIFVVVDQKPVRASRKSIEWCLKAVDQCWVSKGKSYRAEEQADALAAYEQAREVYRKRLLEVVAD